MESANFLQKRNLRRDIRAYWALIFVVTALMAYYSYNKVTELLDKSGSIDAQSEILSNLETTLSKEESEYKNLKSSKLEEFQDIEKGVDNIFPSAENYTNLTRELDSFFLSLSQTNNPILVSNLQYGAPKLADNGEYYSLPITLTITATKSNFLKFLDYVERSGNLKGNIRLIDIQAIKINLNKAAKNGEEVSLSVNMNSYFKSNGLTELTSETTIQSNS